MGSNRISTFRQSHFDASENLDTEHRHRGTSAKFPRMQGELLDQPYSLSYELEQFVATLLAEPEERVIRVSVPLVIGKFRADFYRLGSVKRRRKHATRIMEQFIRLVLGRVASMARSMGIQTRVPVIGPCVYKDNGVMQVAFHVPLDVNFDLIHAKLQTHLELHAQNLDREKFAEARIAKRMERWLDSPNVLHRMAVPQRKFPHAWTAEEEQFAAKNPRRFSATEAGKNDVPAKTTPYERIHSLLESRPFVGEPISDSDFEELRKWREHQASLPFVSREDLLADATALQQRIGRRNKPQEIATAGVNATATPGRSPASFACSTIIRRMLHAMSE